MSTDLEQALRDAFRQTAETVVPRPEPMRRLLQRRRRRWAGLTSFFAAVAVAASAALVPALQVGSPERRDGDEGYPITSPWTRRLLDSPTRGSLSGSGFQAEVERGISDRGGDARLDRVKVLFLGDVAGRRFVGYARYNDTHAALYYNDGAVGDSAARLAGGGLANLRLDPLVRMVSTTGPALVGLVPADCRIATSSAATVSGFGTRNVVREWTESPTGSWVARASSRPAERWRVTCDTEVYSEGPAVPVSEVAEGVDPVAAGGLTHGAVVQRWSGQLEGFGPTWTLTSTLLPGGGTAVVLASGTSGKFTVATGFAPTDRRTADDPTVDRDGWGLMSTAVSLDPRVIAVRVPERSGAFTYYGDKVLVVTSVPGAWSVLAPTSPGFTGDILDNGVGVVRTAGGILTVQNAADATVGSTYVADSRDVPEYLGEKLVSNW